MINAVKVYMHFPYLKMDFFYVQWPVKLYALLSLLI